MKTGKYYLKWEYDWDRTRCIIIDDKTREEVGIGEARCSDEDNFVKDIGRKVSLTRALRDGEFYKDERARIWEDYRNSAEKPRW